MTRCPYCRALCNPLRFVMYSRWSPYSCPQCGEKSKFRTGGAAILIGTVVGVLTAISHSLSALVRMPLILAAILMAMWSLLKLHPIHEQKNPNKKVEHISKGSNTSL